MAFSGSVALTLVLSGWGPPTLPPLPGERPSPPAEPAPAQPTEPSTPAPSAPPPRKPIEPSQPPLKPAPWTAPETPPQPTPSPDPGPTTPEPPPTNEPSVVEPPQPSAGGPAPEASPTQDSRPRRGGPGQAPLMGAELLPGDEPPPAMLRLPPPRRPPYSGLGLFIGAGVTFSAALAEQIVAHVLIKRRCIEPFAANDEPDPMMPDDGGSEAEDFGQALLECAPGVLPAIALRVHSDLGLLATIGLASAGAALRGQQRAYDDVFGDRPPRRMLGLRAAGISLIGAGVVTWLTTGAASWGLLASCRDARCATRARLMAFTTRDTAAVLITAGSGMLAYSMTHARAYDRFLRDRAMSVGTAWVPGGAGLSLSGRF